MTDGPKPNATRRFPKLDPFRVWPSINGVVFGSLLAGLAVAAWVLIHRDAGFAAAGKPAVQKPRFAVSALLVMATPTGINYELELGVLDAADADDARAKSSVPAAHKHPGHELRDVVAIWRLAPGECARSCRPGWVLPHQP